jgi:hypothetical protein
MHICTCIPILYATCSLIFDMHIYTKLLEAFQTLIFISRSTYYTKTGTLLVQSSLHCTSSSFITGQTHVCPPQCQSMRHAHALGSVCVHVLSGSVCMLRISVLSKFRELQTLLSAGLNDNAARVQVCVHA